MAKGLWLTLGVLTLLGFVFCSRGDPYTRALLERQSLAVELLSWSPREDRVLFEVKIAGHPRSIEQLTVVVKQYSSDEKTLREDRVVLDLEGMEPTGVKQMFGSVPTGGAEPDSLSVEIEVYPPEGALGEYPELRSLRPETPDG